MQLASATSKSILSNYEIERGIQKVVEALGKSKPTDFEELTYTPVTVGEKINFNKHYFLYNEVLASVTKYYTFVEKMMQEQAKKKEFDDELLRAQIKALYKKLAARKCTPEDIFVWLSEKLQKQTKQDYRYCVIVISYFVQSCEVFDATP